MIGRFLKHYGKGKIEQGIQALNDAIVRFDPEGATQAGLEEMEEMFDKVNMEFARARQEWQKEQKEADAIVEVYNRRLAAAERLQAQLEADPDNEQVKTALDQLVTALEEMYEDVELEKAEAADAKEVMDEIEAVVQMYAEKLKSARRELKKASQTMERAKRQEQLAKERAERAAVAAGLKEQAGGMGSVLEAMNRNAMDAQAKADAAKRKAELLGKSSVDENEIIASVMDEIDGKSSATESPADRLAKLRRV